MTEADQRAAVIREALTWQGTPFMWEACIKGVGGDCGRFLAAAFNGAGVKSIQIENLPHLSPQWFQHASDESFLKLIRPFAVEYALAPGQIPKPADIVVARQGRDWAHSALVIAWPRIIGAAYGHSVTVWNSIFRSPQYMNRDLKFFDAWRQP